jgi:hypothetical protein
LPFRDRQHAEIFPFAQGGERVAAMYTLIETAKLNGLDPDQPDQRPPTVEHRPRHASPRRRLIRYWSKTAAVTSRLRTNSNIVGLHSVDPELGFATRLR